MDCRNVKKGLKTYRLLAPEVIKLRLKSIGVLFVLLVLLNSCDKFLDESPDNRVELDNLDKAAQLLTSGYSIASPAFTDWMSDDFTYTFGTVIRPEHTEMYAWDDVTTGPDELDTPNFYWYETYNAIAHANEVLAIIDKLVVSEEEYPRRNAIKAEALLIRAYSHFMLVNLFGEQYGTNDSSDGVPYIRDPETTFIETYERESVKKVYVKIEDDLLEGLKMLDDAFYNNSGKYHFNKNAALAFASRFYLFKGDLIRCAQYTDELLGASPEVFVRDLTSEEFQNQKSSITGYPRLYSSPDLPSNILLMRKISLVQRPDFAYGVDRNFYGSLFATNPFGATDERENPAFIKGQNALFPVRYESLFERSSLNSNVGTPYHIGIMFRGEEVLMNRIEINIYQNNLTEALADLQILTDKRYTGADVTLTMDLLRKFYGAEDDDTFTDEDILLNYLLLERRKEFIGQGYRWFDIKRYQIAVDHLQSDGVSIDRLQSNDKRKILQIPPSAVDVGGLEKNPR